MERKVFFASREEIREARIKDLFSYLLDNHRDLFIREGRYLRMTYRKRLCIKRGIPGFNDFASGEHGNSIDFLVKYLHYTFTDAVAALNGAKGSTAAVPSSHALQQEEPLTLPVPANSPYSRVHAYLRQRGLSASLINSMITRRLLYQDVPFGNAVFVTPEQDYCEIRGTLTYTDKPFHGCRKLKTDRFWYYTDSANPQIAYICEAAIDAVSLYCLYSGSGCEVPAVFVSIGGVSNQQSINRIKKRFPAVLAVDNDEAGHACRNRNLDIPAVFPAFKDWNEDLIQNQKPYFKYPFPYQTRLF